MNRRLCLLPFYRKVKLTINDVLRMYQGLLRCELNSGAVFVASEHRLSLRPLRRAAGLTRIRAKLDQLHSLPYHDVRATRSYATSSSSSTHGVSCKPLPAGSERWIAAEALLREIQHNPEETIILATPDVSKWQKRQPTHGQNILAGNLDDIRILPGEPLEQVLVGLRRIFAKGVLDDPPYEMRWLRPRGEKHQMHDGIIEFVIDPGGLDHSALFQVCWMENTGEKIKPVQCNHLSWRCAGCSRAACLCTAFRVATASTTRDRPPPRGITRRAVVPFRGSNIHPIAPSTRNPIYSSC